MGEPDCNPPDHWNYHENVCVGHWHIEAELSQDDIGCHAQRCTRGSQWNYETCQCELDFDKQSDNPCAIEAACAEDQFWNFETCQCEAILDRQQFDNPCAIFPCVAPEVFNDQLCECLPAELLGTAADGTVGQFIVMTQDDCAVRCPKDWYLINCYCYPPIVHR